MIDLEEALAELVDVAPAPPDISGVTQRARQRRSRRHGTALVAALVVVAAGIAGIVTLRPTHASKVILAPAIESVRVTLLDGSQLEISGPESLGLTKLEPAFNAQLDFPGARTLVAIGHSFTVQRHAPKEAGAVVGRYPTGDGHELVVYTTPDGVDAVVQYPGWALVASWNKQATSWGAFASALNARRTAEGFLVIAPEPGWRLGPTDAPDVQLGGEANGSDAAFSFFGPSSTYPAGCPTENKSEVRTAQGWPVSEVNGTWWCDPDQDVRIRVGIPALADTAIRGLRVEYSDPGQVVDATTLDGQSFEITGPANVLDLFVVQESVAVTGLTTKAPYTVSASRLPQPIGRNLESNTTADGHEFVTRNDPDGSESLIGTYGEWTVSIFVPGTSVADRARIASLFAAHLTADGFLVLDLRGPMHLIGGLPSDISLDGVDIVTRYGRIQVGEHTGNPQLADQVHVRRIG